MDEQQKQSLIEAGKVAADLHLVISKLIKPGVNVLEIEALAKRAIADADMQPAFTGFNGYPAVTCVSINDEIVHGIPTNRVLEEGDIVSVDLGVSKNGWIVDTARTHPVGEVDTILKKLLQVTDKALIESFTVIKPGKTVGDIGAIIEKTVKDGHFYIVRDLTGHAVGKTLQENPTIPNHGRPGKGPTLKEGMVLAIEPITTVESCQIGIAEDGWTIVSDNGTYGAHFEDTVIVTADGPLVLTRHV